MIFMSFFRCTESLPRSAPNGDVHVDRGVKLYDFDSIQGFILVLIPLNLVNVISC